MSRSFAELLAQLPDLLGGHLVLSVGALVVGIVVSIPLGAIATRRAGLRGPLLTVAGLIQTVPALALLALMVPLLGGRIGFLPAFLALTLYSVLPMLRNTVTGILDVDRAVTEAARGVGMTDRQSLLRVELPLAAPVIIAGIRTATVWVVGMATLATPVGAPSLGQYIFLGLQTRNWGAVLFGCAAAALLAIVLDQLIRALEHAARTRNRSLRVGALGALAAIVIAGVAPFALERVGSSSALPGAGDESGERAPPFDGRTLTVGTKGFTEQYILGDLLRRQLEDHGAVVESKPNLGSTVLFDALREDTVDVCVDYTGTIWTTVMKRAEPVARVPMQIDMAAYLKDEHGVITLGALGFENAYCLAMRRDRARELGVRTIADLARHGDLTVGGDPEVFGRPEWTRVRDAYGLGSLRTRAMDSTFMYGAVRDRQVDLITAYSTDGRIDAFDLVVLRDPRQAFPPYDAVVLLSPRAATTTGLVDALRPLLGGISDARMRAANRAVDIDERAPAEAGQDLWTAIRAGRDAAR